MNLELKAKITKANVGIHDINGYKYNEHRMSIVNLEDFPVLLPIFDDVTEGDCFISTKWIITCLDPSVKPNIIMVRVDEAQIVSDENFECTEYLNTKVTGLFCSSDKCFLRVIGPDRKPFYNATLKINNPFGQSFDMYLVAFGNQAKRLSTFKTKSVVELEVTVKRSKHYDNMELAVRQVIKIKQEGQDNKKESPTNKDAAQASDK